MFTTPVPVAVTRPVEETVAIEVFPLVHVPPEGDPVNVVLAPPHNILLPLIDAAALTVTVFDAVHPPAE